MRHHACLLKLLVNLPWAGLVDIIRYMPARAVNYAEVKRAIRLVCVPCSNVLTVSHYGCISSLKPQGGAWHDSFEGGFPVLPPS